MLADEEADGPDRVAPQEDVPEDEDDSTPGGPEGPVGTPPSAPRIPDEGVADEALPFTGLGLGALLMLALLSLAGGLALRRLADRPGA